MNLHRGHFKWVTPFRISGSQIINQTWLHFKVKYSPSGLIYWPFHCHEHAQKVGIFLPFVKILAQKTPHLCEHESGLQSRTLLFTYLLSIWCSNIFLDLWSNVESDDNFETWSCSCFNGSWDTSIVFFNGLCVIFDGFPLFLPLVKCFKRAWPH